MDYCTLADVKLPGRLDIESNDHDTALLGIMTAASRWIDRYCKLPVNGFAQMADATRYYGDRCAVSNVLRLDAPLCAVTTVTNGDGGVVSSGAYRLWPRNAEYATQVHLLSAHAWTFSLDGEIAITGRWGMATVTPAPVKEACIMLSAWTFKRYQAGLQDASASADLGQLVYSEGVPKQVMYLLQGFRWVVI